jgi:pimeloyl-ACP methyl ester carboxylesterase
VRERLQRIPCPTLVISADRDYTSVEAKQAYVTELPDARLQVIDNSRHATPLDQPQRFNTALLDFFAEVDGTANKER